MSTRLPSSGSPFQIHCRWRGNEAQLWLRCARRTSSLTCQAALHSPRRMCCIHARPSASARRGSPEASAAPAALSSACKRAAQFLFFLGAIFLQPPQLDPELLLEGLGFVILTGGKRRSNLVLQK